MRIILPAGLSFFIFTILSYLIEIKRGTIEAERHIGIFALSLMFFPKIMMGPIEKPGNIFPQLRAEKNFDYEMVVDGLKQILWGYFKKLVIADRLAIYVNAVYGNHEQQSGISFLIATIFYSFQIYTDFSGYTDIALGSSKILGFKLTNNFNRPCFATSIREFWNRWHISLSIWLRDYLFLPLVIFLSGKIKQAKYLGVATRKWIFMVAAIMTFSLYGIWHGIGLNFLLWGLLFGIYLTVGNWTFEFSKKLRKILHINIRSGLYKMYGIAVTFFLVSFAWIFFRADNSASAFSIIKSMVSLSGPVYLDLGTIIYSIIGIGFLLLIEIRRELSPTSCLPFKTKHWFAEHLAYAMLAIIILLVGVFDGEQFIYFRF
ncbi:MAG: MBOAT family protein [Bacteroidales bacterium]|nr:MBOAT family protein [Bacteroidales bacterium]